MRGFVARSLIAMLSLLTAGQVWAQRFSHKDWELACDNTRTCRAAGYQRDRDQDAPLSVLLVRPAGKGAPVTGRVMIGSYDDQEAPQPARVEMAINGKSYGFVPIRQDDRVGDLAAAQVTGLLSVLAGRAEVVFSAGQHRWRLSDEGAAAVLLKMDTVQGRLATPSALVRRGRASEEGVLPPVPMPVVQAVRVAPAQPGDAKLGDLIRPHLKTPGEDECVGLMEAKERPEVRRLNAGKVLVSVLCWRAAYNEGYGFWVSNDKPPYAPRLVTVAASEFDGVASISAAHKGRGLGDCWSSEQWVWNGQDFVHTASATTGMCKLVAAGGAWELPTLVTEVRPPR